MLLQGLNFSIYILSLVGAVRAGVVVHKTGRGPTGYEVEFTYRNSTAKNVTVGGGGMHTFTDEFHTSPQSAATYDPLGYNPGDFVVNLGQSQAGWPYVMRRGNGSEKGDESLWTLTVPLPSGTYSYAFLVDCDVPKSCTIDTGNLFVDPENPPFVNVPGDMISSTVQVPFDSNYQYYENLNLNFDYTLPVTSMSSKGTIKAVNYTSPGSQHPAPNVHDYVVYLPAGYKSDSKSEYPILYISHGGIGNAYEWVNLGQVHHILDRLISEGYLEPTVAVMPSFYNLNASWGDPLIYGSSNGTPGLGTLPQIRENFMTYLFPHIEATYAVSRSPERRGFCGMSKGASMTYEMYVNATSYFSYFGHFSGAFGLTVPPLSEYVNSTMLSSNPRLGEVGVFLSFGQYDVAFQDTRNLQEALDGIEVGYVARFVPYGSHYWNTWQDAFWNFGRSALWKSIPFTTQTGRRGVK